MRPQLYSTAFPKYSTIRILKKFSFERWKRVSFSSKIHGFQGFTEILLDML